jgi:hypothetical protein
MSTLRSHLKAISELQESERRASAMAVPLSLLERERWRVEEYHGLTEAIEASTHQIASARDSIRVPDVFTSGMYSAIVDGPANRHLTEAIKLSTHQIASARDSIRVPDVFTSGIYSAMIDGPAIRNLTLNLPAIETISSAADFARVTHGSAHLEEALQAGLSARFVDQVITDTAGFREIQAQFRRDRALIDRLLASAAAALTEIPSAMLAARLTDTLSGALAAQFDITSQNAGAGAGAGEPLTVGRFAVGWFRSVVERLPARWRTPNLLLTLVGLIYAVCSGIQIGRQLAAVAAGVDSLLIKQRLGNELADSSLIEQRRGNVLADSTLLEQQRANETLEAIRRQLSETSASPHGNPKRAPIDSERVRQ